MPVYTLVEIFVDVGWHGEVVMDSFRQRTVMQAYKRGGGKRDSCKCAICASGTNIFVGFTGLPVVGKDSDYTLQVTTGHLYYHTY